MIECRHSLPCRRCVCAVPPGCRQVRLQLGVRGCIETTFVQCGSNTPTTALALYSNHHTSMPYMYLAAIVCQPLSSFDDIYVYFFSSSLISEDMDV